MCSIYLPLFNDFVTASRDKAIADIARTEFLEIFRFDWDPDAAAAAEAKKKKDKKSKKKKKDKGITKGRALYWL